LIAVPAHKASAGKSVVFMLVITPADCAWTP
jgi:hypothetical protein